MPELRQCQSSEAEREIDMVPASKVRDSSFHLIYPAIHSTKRPCHVISTSPRKASQGLNQTRQLLHLSHALATIAANCLLDQPSGILLFCLFIHSKPSLWPCSPNQRQYQTLTIWALSARGCCWSEQRVHIPLRAAQTKLQALNPHPATRFSQSSSSLLREILCSD